VSGGPVDWKLSPNHTCVQPQDTLEFLPPDGGVLPNISFDVPLTRLFESVDGGSFVPPGRSATQWEAVIQADAGSGCYRFSLSQGTGDGGDKSGCDGNGGHGRAGESGDLEVVSDGKNPGPGGDH
jgi:hypothetical protein